MIEDDPCPEIVGQLQGILRRGDPTFKPLGVAIAPSRRIRDRSDREPFVAEPLANLPQPRLRQALGIEATAGIELHCTEAEVMRCPQCLLEVTGKRDSGYGESGGVHERLPV